MDAGVEFDRVIRCVGSSSEDLGPDDFERHSLLRSLAKSLGSPPPPPPQSIPTLVSWSHNNEKKAENEFNISFVSSAQ